MQDIYPMTDVNLFDNLPLAVTFLVPGLIAMFVRSLFVTGRRPPHSEELLSYFAVSVIYFTLTFPFVGFVVTIDEPGTAEMLMWFAWIVVVPAVLGLLLGVDAERRWLRRCLRKCGFNPVPEIPTAWDWKLGDMSTVWILVTLKDGTRFGGVYGDQSYASDDPAERDLYIQWIYDIDDNDCWHSRDEAGVLITANEIQTIEFWPYTPQENPDDQEG